HPYAAGEHRGIDIGDASGSDVRAPIGGVVSFAGTVPTAGHGVTVQTVDGLSVTLTHLGTVGVARGASVAEGDTVGTIGPSGDADVTAPFVQLGVRTTADQQGYLDPLAFLPARPAPTPAPVSAPA